MFAALANGPSKIINPLQSEDAEATERCLRAIGIQITHDRNEICVVPGPWNSPSHPIDCGNSGTTMRLLSGLIAGKQISAQLYGDASLSKRPMKRIAEPLRQMGAVVEGDFPPITIKGHPLNGIDYTTPVASAQVKSCIILAGLFAQGETTISEPHPSRDHTERMLTAMGANLTTQNGVIHVNRSEVLHPFEFDVPSDISAAAFFLVAAAILPNSNITCQRVTTNPTRTGIADVLAQCGMSIDYQNPNQAMGEPFADWVTGTPPLLQPFIIEGPLVPRLIDEIPVLAVLATQCHGTSIIRNAAELRVKESDRIQVIADGLQKMGANIEAQPDGLIVHGPTPLHAATLNSQGDHRMGMAFAIAGLIATGTTIIDNAEAIATSFPTFESELLRLAQ